MAFYAPHNEFFLPNPMLIGQSTPDFTKYFIYGSAYGGIISILYCNPIPRAIKFTLTWGAVFGFGFTRGLYNSPGYLKRTDLFKPDLDRDRYIIILYIFYVISRYIAI